MASGPLYQGNPVIIGHNDGSNRMAIVNPYYEDKWVKIYHGDCREILPELPRVDLVLTDPPYKNNEPMMGWWWRQCHRLTKNIIFTPGIDNVSQYPQPKWILCWHKPSGISYSRIGGFNQWEPIYVYGSGYKFGQDYFYQVPLNFSVGPEKNHPHPKPPALWSWLISSTKAETILDPFLGSGTTCYCAKKLNRKSIGIEIEEKYCEIAANRCRQMVFDLGAMK